MNILLIRKCFPQFSDALCEDLERSGHVKQVADHTVITYSGQRINEATIILSGSARLSRETSGGAECTLCFLDAGASFATTLSSENEPAERMSMLTMTAVGHVILLSIPLIDKDKLAQRYPEWYTYILKTSNYYHKLLLQSIDNVAFQPLDKRINDLLIQLSQARDTDRIEISHQELATHLNSSREAVSRLLKKMELSGRLQLNRNMIKLNNVVIV